MSIYENIDQVKRIFGYLGFKLDCLRGQQEVGITMDANLVDKSMLDLEFIIGEKTIEVSGVMPRKIEKYKPKKYYKINGELSKGAIKWLDNLKELGLSPDSEYIDTLGNPSSTSQLKAWLYILGWVPITFKVSTSTGKSVEQVRLPEGGGLCPSVLSLIEENPEVAYLEGLSVAEHRYGLFKSFRKHVDAEGKIYATAQGFTNTLRLQHKAPVVNLPGVHKWYGEQIRGVLTVPNEGYTMCGSDITGLEDNTKQHYIYYYDPEYVKEMRVPGFDPHIDIGVLAGMITKDEEKFYKWYNDK